MTRKKPARETTKTPRSVFVRPIKIDLAAAFVSLSKAIGHGATANWGDLCSEVIDIYSAFGTEASPGELAWALFHRAASRAIFDIVYEVRDLFNSPVQPKSFPADLVAMLDENPVELDTTFLASPAESTFVRKARVSLETWLELNGLSRADANAISARYPSFFIYALREEWRKNQGSYSALKDYLQSPFASADETQRQWDTYAAYLYRETDARLFGESFSLRSIYVPPRAYFIRHERQSTHSEVDFVALPKNKVVVELREALDAWLEDPSPATAIQVISGDPGSGKSSFIKMYSAKVAHEGKIKTIVIPLHQFELKSDFVDSLNAFCRDHPLLPKDPISSDSDLLIVFDGLDELSQQGKLGEEVARNFVREVERTVATLNTLRKRIRILLTGRPVAVDWNQSEFRRTGQVLHLVPLKVEPSELGQFADPRRLLKEDHRKVWWELYSQAKGLPDVNIPRRLLDPSFEAITSQPLLIYLVALSYERKKIDFSRPVELNVLYHDLFEAVYERSYSSGPHPATKGLTFKEFIRVVEEIALAAWHRDGRSTTVREIETQCRSAKVLDLLNVFEQGVSSGIGRLLTAFYFREHGRDVEGDKTYEFTHKSFGEYLAALRVVRELRRVHDMLQRRTSDPDEGWDEREALEHWIQVCGQSAIDDYIVIFIQNEIRLSKEKTVSAWQLTLTHLISWVLRQGMPMERIPNLTFATATKQCRNSEEALLVCLAACATKTRDLSNIKWPTAIAAGEWIGRLLGQRRLDEKRIAAQCFD